MSVKEKAGHDPVKASFLLAHPQFFLDMYMCYMIHVQIMSETLDDVRKWFLKEVEKLWPLAGGSLSLRKNRCIRPNCPVCRSGEGHPAYALHTRSQGRQTSVYVPDELAEQVEGAVQNRKKLQDLLVEVGRRYVNALKVQRKRR